MEQIPQQPVLPINRAKKRKADKKSWAKTIRKTNKTNGMKKIKKPMYKPIDAVSS